MVVVGAIVVKDFDATFKSVAKMRPFLRLYGQKNRKSMAIMAICLGDLYMIKTYVWLKHMADLMENIWHMRKDIC